MQGDAQERYRIEGCFFLYGDPSQPCRASGSTQQNVQSRVIHTKLPRTRIFLALETQNENLVRIGGLLSTIGGTVENAVLRGVQRAVNDADEDGVVEE